MRAFSSVPAGRGRAVVPRHRASHLGVPRNVVVRAEELEEIDPVTGLPLTNQSCRTVRPGLSVDAGGLKWAYRQSEGLGDTNGKAPILLLHGIGSSSYSYRDLMRIFSENGHTCIAPDWPGHGFSAKPTSGFAYDEAAYVGALDEFVDAVGLQAPYFVITHGFVLGQYGLLWAQRHSADIEKMVILNTPLGTGTKLRPELASYKNPVPFLRPKPDAKFAADLYNATGLAFVISYDDTQAYDLPYQEEPAANVALSKTMDSLDWKALLNKVDEAYCSWKVPTAILYGNKDPFLDIRDAMQFLESKRTSMQLTSVEGKLGHLPQEDFAAGFADVLLKYFDGGDITVRGLSKVSRKESA